MPIDPMAIEPGSTDYGDRQTLEAGLAQVGGGAPTGGGGTPSPTTVMPSAGNPLSSLLSGAISPGDSPITSGLSVGPGDGPMNAPPVSPTDNDLGYKLKLIASQSTSPTLRRLAMARLKRMYRGVYSG